MKKTKETNVPFLQKHGDKACPMLFILIAFANVILKLIPTTAMHAVSWKIVLLPIFLPAGIYIIFFIYMLTKLLIEISKDEKESW